MATVPAPLLRIAAARGQQRRSERRQETAQRLDAARKTLPAHFLLPYAPDLNPDEFVWQHAKTNGAAKKPLRKNESLKARVTQDLATINIAPIS